VSTTGSESRIRSEKAFDRLLSAHCFICEGITRRVVVRFSIMVLPSRLNRDCGSTWFKVDYNRWRVVSIYPPARLKITHRKKMELLYCTSAGRPSYHDKTTTTTRKFTKAYHPPGYAGGRSGSWLASHRDSRISTQSTMNMQAIAAHYREGCNWS
jgi:hypothetical protein